MSPAASIKLLLSYTSKNDNLNFILAETLSLHLLNLEHFKPYLAQLGAVLVADQPLQLVEGTAGTRLHGSLNCSLAWLELQGNSILLIPLPTKLRRYYNSCKTYEAVLLLLGDSETLVISSGGDANGLLVDKTIVLE